MADVTGVFKSTVKMLKVRHKDISAIKSAAGDDQQTTTAPRKPNGSVIDEHGQNFSERARQIVCCK